MRVSPSGTLWQGLSQGSAFARTPPARHCHVYDNHHVIRNTDGMLNPLGMCVPLEVVLVMMKELNLLFLLLLNPDNRS